MKEYFVRRYKQQVKEMRPAVIIQDSAQSFYSAELGTFNKFSSSNFIL